MTSHADTVPKVLIKLFPETVGSFAKTPAELPRPVATTSLRQRIGKWLWLPLLIPSVPAFVLGQPVAGIVCLALGVLALMLALAPARRTLEPRQELDAHFDDEGLHLPAEAGVAFIPYADITRILTLDLPSQAGKRVVWWRQYQIHTRRDLDNPHIELNTLRSLESVLSVLNRLKRLPGTRHIEIPPTVETAPPSGAKSKEMRLR